MIRKCFKISGIEWKILQALAGRKEFLGFAGGEEASKTSVLQGFHCLARRKIISVEDEEVVIEESVASMLRQILQASFVIEVSLSSALGEENSIWYIGKELLVQRQAKRQRDFYLLQRISLEEELKEWVERGILYINCACIEEKWIEVAQMPKKYLVKFRKWSREKEVLEEILLAEQEGRVVLWVRNGEQIRQQIYDYEIFIKQVKAMCYGAEQLAAIYCCMR